MAKIEQIYGRQILDSRGNPTVEVDVYCKGKRYGRASVPSGASTGVKEALELRDDQSPEFLGRGVNKAVTNVNEIIAPALEGFKVTDQKKIDQFMLDLDGSENKQNLGANAILAVSLAIARAGARAERMELFDYLSDQLDCPRDFKKGTLPTPLMNIINGGAHASNNLDIQEFMIVPHLKESFHRNLQAGVEVFHHLKKVLEKMGHSTNVGDEGGFAPELKSHDQAMESILQAIEAAGYRPGEEISLALDCASSEYYRGGNYHMEGKSMSVEESLSYYSSFISKYPIYSIEDPMAEDDFTGWAAITKELGDQVLLVGDDLFVTNHKLLAEGVKSGWGNSILIKLNQIGSLSETMETLKLAYEKKYKAIISHRSGETGDSFIADLSVASGAGHIKTGSASRSDRMEKYNQLLRIEELLGKDAHFEPVR